VVPAAPPAAVAAVVTQGSVAGLLVSAGVSTPPFTTTAAGKLDVNVDWTFVRNDVDIYIVRGGTACSAELFNADQCDFVAFSDNAIAKPERLSVPALAAGTYTLLIINWGPDPESVSYQALLTTGGAAAAADRSAGIPSVKAGPHKRALR
jgi:hypothetical protein